MAYWVKNIRCKLECDCCGLKEEHDLETSVSEREVHIGYARLGWSDVVTYRREFFCCPVCFKKVDAVLRKRERDEGEAQAQAQAEADCEHNYRPCGMITQCTKCKRFRP